MADQVIEDIKNRLNIVDVLSGYIQVKRSGTNFKAVCPFHAEKSASLMVSPAKQIWHCFGCGEGGDIFGFVMRMENVEFRDALKILADRAGVQLPEQSGYHKQVEDVKGELLRINAFAAQFYAEHLKAPHAEQARMYLESRGLSQKIIEQWRIGFAPNEFHALEEALVKKGVSKQRMIQAGVSVQGERGNQYDRFRNRITFPIYNYVGDVVGFTARVLPGDDGGAKYINSPETPVYNKSAVLFGLYFAKNDIRKSDNVIVVEGQMDCISPAAKGYTNIVATSGTALTEHHLRAIGKLTKNIKFCFDADSAGQSASFRAGMLALSMGFAVKVVILPSGKDPDELVRKDPSAWNTALRNSQWFIDFYIDKGLQQFSPNSVEQKKYITTTILPMIRMLQDSVERDHYQRRIVERFGISENALRSEIGSSVASVPTETTPALAGTRVTSAELLQKEVLGGMLVFPQYKEEVRSFITAEDFSIPQIKEIFINPEDGVIKESVLAKEVQFMVESMLDTLDGNSAAVLHTLRKSAFLLHLSRIKESQTAVSAAMRTAESLKDTARLRELNQQFVTLSQERLVFENKINNN